jgi:hypothetical protein
MSTAEAIRIGTATTGRLITAAALVLAVVAGSFVFSDLVMMKYLAFGLMAALLLDATVVRMFLVPSVMKLLGDDCWWAPMWMRRLQNRMGLGEIHLPDERKLPSPRARSARPATTTRPPVTSTPRPPHDPTHPGADGPAAASRPAAPPPRPELPAAGSGRTIGRRHHEDAGPGAARAERATDDSLLGSAERFARTPARDSNVPCSPGLNTARSRRRPRNRVLAQRACAGSPEDRPADPRGPAPRRRSRPRTRPGRCRFRANNRRPSRPPNPQTPPPRSPHRRGTTRTPRPPPRNSNARGENPDPRRRGGGLSAADLLRREGRM